MIELLYDESGAPYDYLHLEVNPAYEQQCGLKDVTGKRVREVIPEIEAYWIETYAEVARTGHSLRFVNQVRGLNRWFEVFAFRLGDETNRQVGILLDDVTEQSLATHALRESEERLRLATQAADMYSWELDLAKRRFRVSENTQQVIGFVPPEQIDEAIACIHEEDRAAISQALSQMWDTGGDSKVEMRWHHPVTGQEVWTAAAGVTVSDATGAAARIVGITQNITQRKQAEEQLRHAAELDAFRVALNDALRPLTDPLEIQATATRLLGAQMNASRCFYGEALSEGESFVIERDYSLDVPSLVGQYRLSDFGPTIVTALHEGRKLVIANTDTATLTPRARAELAALAIRSFVVIPLVKNGQFVAALSVNQTVPRAWTNDEVALIEEIAERMWAAVEQSRAEAALHEAHRHLTSIVESISDCFYALDRELRFTYVNQQTATYFGLPKEAMLGRTITDVLPHTIGHDLLEKFHEALQEQRPTHIEFRSSLTGRWVDLTANPAESGLVVYFKAPTSGKRSDSAAHSADGGLAVFFRDVTSRIQADAALRASEKQLTLALAASSAGCWSYEITTNTMKWDDRHHALYGFAPDAPRTFATWLNSLHADDQRNIQARLAQMFTTPGDDQWEVEYRALHPTKGARWLLGLGRLERDAEGKPTLLTGINLDITERKQIEASLQQAYDELLVQVNERRAAEAQVQELLHRVVTAQEYERQRISRELHDEMGQRLTALSLEVKAMQDAAGCSPQAVAQLERLKAFIAALDADVDRLAFELHPPVLNDLGVTEALHQYVKTWATASHILVDFQAIGAGQERYTIEAETALYRIAQEALTNILKHANATQVGIIVERRRTELRLIIEDNGSGFDAEAVRHTPDAPYKTGLRGMRERLVLLGGALIIETAPGQGTTIYAAIPVKSEQGG